MAGEIDNLRDPPKGPSMAASAARLHFVGASLAQQPLFFYRAIGVLIEFHVGFPKLDQVDVLAFGLAFGTADHRASRRGTAFALHAHVVPHPWRSHSPTCPCFIHASRKYAPCL